MTSDSTSTLERIAGRIPMPEPAYERFLVRSDRRRRNQRITAGVVGIAVFVVAVWIVTNEGWWDRREGTTPAETGPRVTAHPYVGTTYTLAPVSPKDIALGESFMNAWLDGDGEAAASMFTREGTFDGLGAEILPALHDWFRAEGWKFSGGGCSIQGWGPKLGVVGCGFTFENDLTRALGMSPVESTLSFAIDAGQIEAAWYGGGGDVGPHLFGSPNFRRVWYTFIDWISSKHPDDFIRMYDEDRGNPILDPTSIELWRRDTGEFIASPQMQALARSIRVAGWTGVGIPPEGTPPSIPVEGDLVAQYGPKFREGFVFVYADGRVISRQFGSDTNIQRRLSPGGVDLVRSGAIQPEDLLWPVGSDAPASAWADPARRPYVPSWYGVCYYQESGEANPGTINDGYEYPSTVLRFFPAPARAILRGKDHTFSGDPGPRECSEVGTDETRALADILSDGIAIEDLEGDRINLEISEVLPHGDLLPMMGG